MEISSAGPTPSRMQVGAGLACAASALVAAAVLLHYDVRPVPSWFYVFAWYPTLVILDLVVVRLGGASLFAHPRGLLTTLWWSAIIWFLFEAINFRLQNWYYVFLPVTHVERWAGITVSLATVVPAILLPERVLERLGVWRTLRTSPMRFRDRDLRYAFMLGAVTLGATLAFPRQLYPLTWGAVWLIAEPLLYRADPTRSLFNDMIRGDWGRIARLMASGLLAGGLWEAFNAPALGKWIYTVPLLEHFKVFEMPPIGFLGFAFFALEVWSLYHLLAPKTGVGTITLSALFGVLVLLGMDRWTVSSTVPTLAQLPGVTNPAVRALRAAGLDRVFRIALLPPDELSRRTGLTWEAAQRIHNAAELSTLRGIGARHAAALMAGGITSVAALAAAAPDSIYEIAHRGPRPTLPEVRVWISAARVAVSGLPVSAASATAPPWPAPPTAAPSAPVPGPRMPAPP